MVINSNDGVKIKVSQLTGSYQKAQQAKGDMSETENENSIP